MTSLPMKHCYMGKCVDDMTREELLEVVDYLSKQQAFYTSPERSRAFALGSVEMLKRGERQFG